MIGNGAVVDYERNGILVFDPQIPKALLDKVVDDITPLFNDSNDGVVSESGAVIYRHRIQDAFLLSEAVRTVAAYPTILGLLHKLYGRTPFCFQTLNFRVGTQQALHSDTIHFNSDPPGFMCGVWLALEDVDVDNGPLVYLPGSHKWPEVTMKDVGVPSGYENYPHYERYIAKMVESGVHERQFGTIKKGQAILWASNLLHGGSPINDGARTRLSQVSHYYFEGCTYFTPMLSSANSRSTRDPVRLYEDRLVRPGTALTRRYRSMAASVWRRWLRGKM